MINAINENTSNRNTIWTQSIFREKAAIHRLHHDKTKIKNKKRCGVCLYGGPMPQCTCPTAAALIISVGSAVAPPDRHRHPAGRPGPPPSFLRAPPRLPLPLAGLRVHAQSYCKCTGEHKRGEQEEVERGFLTRQFVGHVEAQLVQNLGHDGVAARETETSV